MGNSYVPYQKIIYMKSQLEIILKEFRTILIQSDLFSVMKKSIPQKSKKENPKKYLQSNGDNDWRFGKTYIS